MWRGALEKMLLVALFGVWLWSIKRTEVTDLVMDQVEEIVVLHFEIPVVVIGQKLSFARRVEIYPSYFVVGDSLQDATSERRAFETVERIQEYVDRYSGVEVVVKTVTAGIPAGAVIRIYK